MVITLQTKVTHPYMPSSDQRIKEELMSEIGIKSIDELYTDIPESVRLKRRLKLPPRMSEFEVRKHIDGILSQNNDASQLLSPDFVDRFRGFSKGGLIHCIDLKVHTLELHEKFIRLFDKFLSFEVA